MPRLRLEQVQSQQMRQELSQVLRMEQADLLDMPENEFLRLIDEVEQSPLFRRLHRTEKLIRYQRVPQTDLSSHCPLLKEEIASDNSSPDVEALLVNKESIIREIQKLGMEKFKRYFLFAEPEMTLEKIALECGLAIGEVQKINNLINDVAVMSEFNASPVTDSGGRHYNKVASIEKTEAGFVIGYFSPRFARGLYQIDYARFDELKKTGQFDEAEAREAKRLFKKLELINSRKDTLGQILSRIIDKQALYLESGDVKALLPLSQKEMARESKLAPSAVSRAISDKSIETPWGQEVPLAHLFPRPRKFRKELLRTLLENNPGLASDEVIRARLQEKFGVAVSRRSVADLRKELKIPSSRQKRQAVRG
ncbi:MAG: hypothetical protein ABIH70_09350 [Chloroflexota bacterium]